MGKASLRHDEINGSAGVMGPAHLQKSYLLSESDILTLQDLFIEPGTHHLQVGSMHEARTVIYLFLGSMGKYKNPACLSAFPEGLEMHITSLYEQLNNTYEAKNTQNGKEDALYSFFDDLPSIDFLWIELSVSLQKKAWFNLFKEMINDLGLFHHMPIIYITDQGQA